MPVTYTNRKDKTYYLHQGTTKKGNPNYFFAQRDEGNLIDTIPPGYEIYENPNAQVFLRRKRAPIITDEEVATVKAGMQQYCRLERFIIDVKKNAIIIYTPDQDVDLLVDTLDSFRKPGGRSAKAVVEKFLTYSPMLQFILIDKDQRLFETQRYSFLGSIDDWMTIDYEGKLPKLVKTYVQHLGEDSFYELY
ncbi:MAG: hypothetical protein AB8I58_21575 [Anaerolineales bacterium]|jgi:hypothetical protein